MPPFASRAANHAVQSCKSLLLHVAIIQLERKLDHVAVKALRADVVIDAEGCHALSSSANRHFHARNHHCSSPGRPQISQWGLMSQIQPACGFQLAHWPSR
jgi:hypothetical protein